MVHQNYSYEPGSTVPYGGACIYSPEPNYDCSYEGVATCIGIEFDTSDPVCELGCVVRSGIGWKFGYHYGSCREGVRARSGSVCPVYSLDGFQCNNTGYTTCRDANWLALPECVPSTCAQASLLPEQRIEKGCDENGIMEESTCLIGCKRGFAVAEERVEGLCVADPSKPTASYRGQSTSCSECPPGRYGNLNYSCSDCPAGEFQPLAAMTSCVLCPRGWSGIGDSGAVKCRSCGEGSYSGHDGSKFCVSCPQGWHQDDVEQGSCRQCPSVG